MENLFNGEFEYESKIDLMEFIKNADFEDAVKIIELSLNHANEKGSFNLLESFCVHQCLEIIRKNKNT